MIDIISEIIINAYEGILSIIINRERL